MRAVVLGATGLVGGSLVRQLSNAPHITEIIALTRRPITYGMDNVTNMIIDFTQIKKSLKDLQADLLFSCLGTTKKIAGSIDMQRKVDLDYQLEVAHLLYQHGVKHYFLVSAAGANPKSRNPYLKMKGELEEAISRIRFETKHILQPSLLMGPREDYRLGEAMGGTLMPFLTKIPGLRHYKPIHVDEVAEKMVQLSREHLEEKKTHTLLQVFPS